MAKEFIYVQLKKEWGGFRIDDVIRFGYSKGERIIEQGIGIKVRKQQAVNDPPPPKPEIKKQPIVETADAPKPEEKAVVTPEIKTKDKAVIEAQEKGEKDEDKKKK